MLSVYWRNVVAPGTQDLTETLSNGATNFSTTIKSEWGWLTDHYVYSAELSDGD